MSNMAETVKFNVGGQLLEVSRSLIDQYPETMLAKLISETWEKEPDKPVFIDRDGEKFAHVLDYLRYGSIELPPSIPRSTFERELDFYGITASNSSVSQLSLAQLTQRMNDQIKHHKTQHSEHKRRKVLLSFAVECHCQFIDGITSFDIKKDHKLYPDCENLSQKELSIVNTFLEQYYGLKVTSSELNPAMRKRYQNPRGTSLSILLPEWRHMYQISVTK